MSDLIAGSDLCRRQHPAGDGECVAGRASIPVLGLRTLVIATPVAAALHRLRLHERLHDKRPLAGHGGCAVWHSRKFVTDQPDGFGAARRRNPTIWPGLLKLGSLVRFVSKSVMLGFTTGIALLIVLGQIDEVTGL